MRALPGSGAAPRRPGGGGAGGGGATGHGVGGAGGGEGREEDLDEAEEHLRDMAFFRQLESRAVAGGRAGGGYPGAVVFSGDEAML